MYIRLPNLIQQYNIKVKGIIHVGAHTGEEDPDYKLCSIPKVVWVEPSKPSFAILSDKFAGDKTVRLINCAFGDVAEDNKPMYVDTVNFGLSSSIMAPKKHLQEYPSIVFQADGERINVRTMDQFPFLREGKYNFLNMDTQGYELKVLQGGPETLKAMDYVYSEVNRDEVYTGNPMIEELDAFLSEFKRVETFWCDGGVRGTWGDAFWIRNSLI